MLYSMDITGTVTDAASGEHLPGVNIYLAARNAGTVSSNDGSFFFDHCSAGDTLVFSSIGFEERRIAASDLINKSVVPLKGYSYLLDEVKVVSITPKELLKQVLENYSKNYGNTPVNIHCNYNEYIFNSDTLLSAMLSEGHFLNYFTTNHISGKQNLYIPEKIQKFSNHGKYSDRQYVYYNGLFDYINIYPFVAGLYPNAELTKDYSITEEKMGSRTVYRLYMEGISRMLFYIDKESKAVISFTREETINGDPIPIRNDTAGFLSKRKLDSYKFVSYRPYNNRWYINAIKTQAHVVYKTTHGDVKFESRVFFGAGDISDDVHIRYHRSQLFNFSEAIYNQLHRYAYTDVDHIPAVPDIQYIEPSH
jgi:hypothetical protein